MYGMLVRSVGQQSHMAHRRAEASRRRLDTAQQLLDLIWQREQGSRTDIGVGLDVARALAEEARAASRERMEHAGLGEEEAEELALAVLRAEVLLAICLALSGNEREAVEAGMALLERDGIQRRPLLRAQVFNMLGDGHDLIERPDTALDFYRRAADDLRGIQAFDQLIAVLGKIGEVCSRLADDQVALSHFEEAIALAEREGVTAGLPWLFLDAAQSHLNLVQLDRARVRLTESEAHAIANGHRHVLTHVWMKRGELSVQLGRVEEACAAYECASEEAQAEEQQYLCLAALIQLAELRVAEKPTVAEAIARRVLASAEAVDAIEWLESAHTLLADLLEARGDAVGALEQHKALLTVQRRLLIEERQGRLAHMEMQHALAQAERERAWLARERRVLAELNRRRVELDRTRRDSMATAAHDLRSPVTLVQMVAGSLTLGVMTPQRVLKAAERLDRAAGRMEAIIDRHLGEEAVQLGRAKVHLQAVDLRGVAERLVNAALPMATSKALDIAVEGLTTRVQADSVAAEQVVDNLLTNAVKFTPPSGWIRVRVSQEGADGIVEVHDSGPGLSLEERDRLFEPYGRGSARPTAGETSSGLGLYICRRLTEEMGGQVRVRESPGGGACFQVRLPLAR